jgi:hypothetical protein
VLTDDVDPACPLRSLSFVEAWYFGTAELAGVAACFCSSVKSVPEVIDRQKLVAATTWSWQGLARALSPVLLIDARMANDNGASTLRDVRGGPIVIAADWVPRSTRGASSDRSTPLRYASVPRAAWWRSRCGEPAFTRANLSQFSRSTTGPAGSTSLPAARRRLPMASSASWRRIDVRERCANPSPEPRSAAERRLGGQDWAPGYHQRIESHCGSAAPHG